MKQFLIIAAMLTSCAPGLLKPDHVTLTVAPNSATVTNGLTIPIKTVSVKGRGITGAIRCTPEKDGVRVCLLATSLAPGASVSTNGTISAAVYQVGDGEFIVITPE